MKLDLETATPTIPTQYEAQWVRTLNGIGRVVGRTLDGKMYTIDFANFKSVQVLAGNIIETVDINDYPELLL